MKCFQAFILVVVATAVSGAAFVPAFSRQDRSTSLAFGFLKELGLEKPSWLPDFGGKKEEPAAEEPAAEAPTEEEAEATAE